MSTSDPGAYGRAFADVYDAWYGDVSDVGATVAALVDLAGAGPVLELGVGTGRLALPLAATGLTVHGIDASPEMLALLARKPGAATVTTWLADMAALPVDGPYTLVLVAFNTLFNLPDDASKHRCVAHVARVLAPGGRLVVEAVVPELHDGRPHHHDERRSDGAGGTVRTLTTHEPGERTVHGVHVHIRADGTTVDRAWRIHYLSPDQLDDLCASVGLAREARWADWSARPWQPDDGRHVSVYRRD